jgi:ParB family transcriptional regulator, chromosome partitioning protein
MSTNKLKEKFGRQRTVESVSEQTSGLAQMNAAPSKFDMARGALSRGAVVGLPAVAVTGIPRESSLQIAAGDLEGASPEYRQWCMANGYRPGTNIEIPLGKLKSSSFNARHFYLPSKIQDLISNIAEYKQQQPIHVIPDYDAPGTFFVNDGGRRWRALEALKVPRAIALVVDLPIGVQSYKLSHDLNNTKEDQTPFDDAMKWKDMLAKGVFKSAREISQVLGVDETQVSKILSLGELPESLLELMAGISAEEMGLRKAYEVGRYWEVSGHDEVATGSLVQQIANGNYSIKRVQAAVSALKTSSPDGKGRSRPVSNRRIDFRLPNGKDAGSLKTYGEDRLDLRVTGLPIVVRDKLQAVIQEELARFVSTKPVPDGVEES